MSAPEVPGYTLLRPLGEGGMATVYLALQHNLQREVALKLMSPAVAAIPEFGERFRQEAHIVARLVHPNIVSVFDVGVAPTGHYVAMEYVEGCDLGHAAEGLGMAAILRLLQELAAALHCAGRNGVVHRDVKPENVLLHAADGRAVLTDFGIAHAIDRATALTRAGMAVGTPHYMSPEQAQGRQVDHRSDLYSLGVLLHFLLLGQVPFDGDSAVAVGLLHVSAPLPLLPVELGPFQPILDRLLAKEPHQRFADGAELIVALRRLPPQALRDADAFLAHRRQRVLPVEEVPAAAQRWGGAAIWRGAALVAATVAVVTGGWLALSTPASLDAPAPIVAVMEPPPAAADPAQLHLQGLAARAGVLEAALQAGWQDELEAELAQLYRDWIEVDPAAGPPRVALVRLQQGALERLQLQLGEDAAPDQVRQALASLGNRFPALAEADAYRLLRRQLRTESAAQLALARERIARDQLAEPAGSSALDALQPLLEREPDHAGARQLLKEIVARYRVLAEEQRQRGDLPAARRLATAGLQVEPGNAALAALLVAPAVAEPQAVAQPAAARDQVAETATSGPKVMALAVSTAPEVADSDPEGGAARTLYVAFEYSQFRTAATVLQAQLFDGGRTHRLAAVPVVVNGGAGVQRFRIERPVEGFTSGGYHLDLMAGELRLASAEFVVGAPN